MIIYIKLLMLGEAEPEN